jgi:K+-sensing histidine kinase KdpD
MPYSAEDFLVDLRTKTTSEFPDDATKLEWNTDVGGATLQIDPQSLQSAVMELLKNAFQHERGDGVISITGRVEGGRFLLVLREPKTNFQLSTKKWGLEPFRSIAQGRYGLGLYRSRAIVESQSGQLTADYDPSAASLVTTINLPVNKSGN